MRPSQGRRSALLERRERQERQGLAALPFTRKKVRRDGRRSVAFGRSRSSWSQRELNWRSGMENSRYRWVIVAAGGLLGCVAIGGMFSLPVFLQPIARDTGWSVTGVSSAMTIGFLAMACTSMAWGTLSDRIGPLPVVLTGSVVLAVSLGLASVATSLVAVQFIFGLMVGV